MDYDISRHAEEKIRKRKIPSEIIDNIMQNPQQIIPQERKCIYQSIVNHEGKEFLARIFVNTNGIKPKIITLYLTSKINKYWKQP